jgi:predicted nucleotidyltransferase
MFTYNKAQVLSTLRSLKSELQSRYRVKTLALFGSVARGEHQPTSDVDILVDFDESATLFELVGLGIFLEEQLGCDVDVVSRRSLRTEIREAVLRDAETV